jgi:4-hydroxyproline epimerase
MNAPAPTRIIDSHTGGEPTRIIVAGGPALAGATMAERRDSFAREHDHWRRALIDEPRGSEVIVGALITEPVEPGSRCGVIFFNNVGCIGMCGHGTIGLLATLAWLGRIGEGEHHIDTPVGTVTATLRADGRVSVANVPAWRQAAGVAVDLPGGPRVHGDVAWGGNWFFLCSDHGLAIEPAQIAALHARSTAIKHALHAAGITGAGGAEIDHIELLGPAADPRHHGRSFVLCPGGAYDRSPCGTGTSAKLACLAADGALAPGERWMQESVIGSVFEACYQTTDISGRIVPTITGRAWVTMDSTLVVDPADPFGWGMPG